MQRGSHREIWFIADGTHTNWEIQKTNFPGAVHVGDFCDLYTQQSTGTQKRSRWIRMMLDGDVLQVIQEMKQAAPQRSAQGDLLLQGQPAPNALRRVREPRSTPRQRTGGGSLQVRRRQALQGKRDEVEEARQRIGAPGPSGLPQRHSRQLLPTPSRSLHVRNSEGRRLTGSRGVTDSRIPTR